MRLKVCVVAGLLLGWVGVGDAKRKSPFSGRVEVAEERFEYPLSGVRENLLKTAKIHSVGKRELIVFIPGIRSSKRVRRFKKGPIASVKVR